MVEPVNDIIANRVIRHAHYVERWKAHEVNEMVRFLNDNVFPDITALIQKRLDRMSPQEARRLAQLQRLAMEIEDQFTGSYRTARDAARSQIMQFAQYESKWMASVIKEAMPIAVDLALPTKSHLRAIMSPNAIEGDVLGKDWSKWWKGFERNTQTRIVQQVRIGLMEGQDTPTIVRRLRGTRANAFADGVYQASRREAEMIVRTAATDASARSRKMLAEANEDIIKGEKYLATLDARTTPICRTLDNRVFEVGKGPRPPQHPNCRSTVYPVVKSWKELGLPFKETDASTRASLNGQVSSDLEYGSWLKKQPPEFQNNVLGPERAELFRSGKVHIDRFNDASGHRYTLDQLEKMDPSVLQKPRTYPSEV